jgi:hypothetical protein
MFFSLGIKPASGIATRNQQELKNRLNKNMNPIMKIGAVVMGGMLLGLAPQAKATVTALGVGDSHAVGYVNPGVDFGDSVIPGYVDPFVTMALGDSQTGNYANHDQTWVRSLTAFPLTTVASGGYPSQGTITSFNIVSGNEYLVAKYDGPNGGLEVWYVGNLSGTITIPQGAPGTDFGQTSDNLLGLSGTWVLNGTPGSVPDGGATVLLLGAALSGLGLIRRKLK